MAIGLFAAMAGAILSPAQAAPPAAHFAVATEHSLATEAAAEILRAGGNAVDAAVAASLAIAVVNPSSAGLGGGGFMLIYQRSEGRAHAIDYRERAPLGATPDLYARRGQLNPRLSKRGGLAVGVPGEPAGLALASRRYGRLPLARVAEPAIRLAAEGFAVGPHLAREIARHRDELATVPELAQVFLDANGKPLAAGSRMVRPALAETLARFAAEGAAPFYEGDIAADIVTAVREQGGVMTAKDLAEYRPVERLPVVTSYRRWRVLGMPPPSSGGGVVAEALQVLAAYRLSDLGFGSPTYLHLLAETLKAVFADRARYYGDADFTQVPLIRLLSAEHAAAIRARLRASAATPARQWGSLEAGADAGTSHISVVDAQGNAVACTSSINTAFGSMVAVPGRGIVLNNTMDDFSLRPGVPNVYGLVGSHANAIAGGKRPLSSMAPTIVLQGNDARLVLGASGGPRIISATLQVLLGVLDFGMDVEEAVRAPRIHHQWLPDRLAVEASLDPNVTASLARRGHQIVPLEDGAAVQAVELVSTAGGRMLRAAADPRKGGSALVE
ncbi:MAG: gamma-glutamyltransferase [Candidatus Dadabacteria bacterium]|nr:MAG: gamma-glutamyltransferase [Candidatus Dadabacteria bacterium]